MAEDLKDATIKKSLSDTKLKKKPHSPVNKLPLASNRTELVWGCVEVDEESASQEFIIKNKSNKKIEFRCSVSNSSFWLVKEGSYFSSTKKVVLHPHESRTLGVTFAPTAQGAAIDKLQFSPINSQNNWAKQFVKPFGYGGQGNVTVNVFKVTEGKFLLPLGNLEEQEMMKVFRLKNNGTLSSFAHALVLRANEEKQVRITYTLKREDFNHIKASMNAPVIEIGKLELICGNEVDRGRLKNYHKRLTVLDEKCN